MTSLRPTHGPRQTWKILSFRVRSWLERKYAEAKVVAMAEHETKLADLRDAIRDKKKEA